MLDKIIAALPKIEAVLRWLAIVALAVAVADGRITQADMTTWVSHYLSGLPAN